MVSPARRRGQPRGTWVGGGARLRRRQACRRGPSGWATRLAPAQEHAAGWKVCPGPLVPGSVSDDSRGVFCLPVLRVRAREPTVSLWIISAELRSPRTPPSSYQRERDWVSYRRVIGFPASE
ncbi:unnamed protein product [Rangifer tarandus platyrhynchus]|uniref:Uncharacterized protein n=2 Tax=Rangifer tarandus platyrhynchus TaxID=3082113 RepID=A0ACB0EMA0_RANTA|nr:unnamed protein product [Rangifer tarandus platyrhynchus]CAI9701574.1 unnamed protein product [Rangifer tarandus platyrhynchus]